MASLYNTYYKAHEKWGKPEYFNFLNNGNEYIIIIIELSTDIYIATTH